MVLGLWHFIIKCFLLKKETISVSLIIKSFLLIISLPIISTMDKKRISKQYYIGETIKEMGEMEMTHLTTKELAFVEDEIRAEEITAKAMNWCASQCKDEELRKSLEQMAESHQLKIAKLSQYFNRTNHIQ